MKKCNKCNLETNDFYTYKKKGIIYFDWFCKDCRKFDWKIKRVEREKKVEEKGFNSMHDFRVKTNENYKLYCKKRSGTYNKKYDL